MKNIYFVCIDDERATVGKILERVAAKVEGLKISAQSPVDFENQYQNLYNLHEKGKLDGLILDLRLDRVASIPGQAAVRYTAPGIAAQLRNWQATNPTLKGFPILLWSVDILLKKGFYPDTTSQDLFDDIYTKDHASDGKECFGAQLKEFSRSYTWIFDKLAAASKLSDFLVPPSSLILDDRIDAEIIVNKEISTFVYAQFIYNNLIKKNGPLIDEEIVFAILGVDKISKNKEVLLQQLPIKSVYKGPFGKVWRRWWFQEILSWWAKQFPDNPILDRVPAPIRLKNIASKLNIKGLKSAEVLGGESPFFTTVCEVTKRPLSAMDGFLIRDPEIRIWQSRRYVCKDVALDPAKYGFREGLDVMEHARVKNLINHGKKK